MPNQKEVNFIFDITITSSSSNDNPYRTKFLKNEIMYLMDTIYICLNCTLTDKNFDSVYAYNTVTMLPTNNAFSVFLDTYNLPYK